MRKTTSSEGEKERVEGKYVEGDKLLLREDVGEKPCYVLVADINESEDGGERTINLAICCRHDYPDRCSWGTRYLLNLTEEEVDKAYYKPSNEEWEKWWGDNHWFICEGCGQRTLARDGVATIGKCIGCRNREAEEFKRKYGA